MNTAKINISFPIRLDTDGNGFSYVEDNRIHVSTYGTNGTATKALKKQLEDVVNVALDNFDRQAKHMIVCNDGHVIVCEYHNGFMYSIASNQRGYASSCLQNWKTLNDVKESARTHANSSYNGIAWESSF